ncbi:MAG: hypothetical protein AMJ59_27800 [Gammaproteobacteria bacterium SG8_31]|nr:MAG: hypothetical protein AMJ59_27800 [Gammaproteobacteria bacterium SG8_31]
MREKPFDRLSRVASRLPVLILAMAGIGLIFMAMLWDIIADGSIGIGGKQIIGILFGAFLVGLAVLLSASAARLRQWFFDAEVCGLSPVRWASALLLVAGATVLGMFLPARELLSATAWILLGYAVAFCLVLPSRLGLVCLLVLLCGNLILSGINTIKVDLTGLPLTMLDIKIAVANPAGLWDAMNLPHWTRHAAVGALLLVGILVVFYSIVTLRRFLSRSEKIRAGWLIAGRSLVLAVILMTAVFHLGRVHTQAANYRGTWEPAGVAALSKQVGILSFLTYSYRAERKNNGDFFSHSSAAPAPEKEEIQDAILDFVSFTSPPESAESKLPNILILMAESTFDPVRAFHLSGTASSRLFVPGEMTAAVGPLFVNAIGGGTWITEFEAIIGLDARLFGYSGYYTHSSLSPFVTRSLATYLTDKGYRTWAFFPHGGDFYNYRGAYSHYGFETILDSEDLDLSDGWRLSDIELVQTFIQKMGLHPEEPFLAHVLLVENHGPHECGDYQEETQPVRFTGTDDKEAQCAIQEYVRRLESTAVAVDSARQYLADLQDRTGRPFVLLVYGDHQPFSFTGTHMVKYDFDPLRKEKDKNVTFFHLISTVEDRLRCCKQMIPATLLPTMVSAYAANGPDDIYLGVNFWLYRQCGHDTVGSSPMNWLTQGASIPGDIDKPPSSGNWRRSTQCEHAYRQALTEYRRSGLLLSTDEQ